MKFIASVMFFILLSVQSGQAQEKPAFSFCDKTGDVTMTWDEVHSLQKNNW